MYEYNKVKGGLFGLLIGDALGVPYEFYEKEYIPSKNLIEFEPPSGFKKTYEDVKSGTWSDDGAQALCLFESLIKNNRLDMNDFSNELIQWYDYGKWAVDNYVFDVGMQTENALILCKKGISPLKSGFVNPEGKGNGSLMRVLPLVLWHKGSDYELVLDAHKQSLVTHGHICNQVCCAFYCVTGREILKGRDFNEAYRNAVIKMRNLYKDMKIYETEFESVIKPDEEMSGKGTGYVVDCLKSSFMILKSAKSYEDAVKSAIALGNDTDTTSAVVGGLAGILFVFDNIPKRWINKLRDKEKVIDLLDKCVKSDRKWYE